MKFLQFVLLTCLVAVEPVAQTGCQQAPRVQVVAVQTLISVGQTVEATLALSASLYRDGLITAVQARQAFDFFNEKWVPAFRLAKIAALSDMTKPAPADLAALAIQMTALVSSFQKP